MRRAKVALASVVAVFCFYGVKQLSAGAQDEGVKALVIAGLAAAGLVALVLKSK